MKHIVSFSGGRTSAYLVHLMEQKRKNEGWDVKYVFLDTGAEHPKTYDFVRACVKHFNIQLTVLKTVVMPEMGVGVGYEVCSLDSIGWNLTRFKSVVAKYSNPCVTSPFCTDRLKTTPMLKYLNATYGKGNYTNWLGMRIDEKRRLKQKPGIKYLAEISIMEKNDILGWWEQMPFDLDINEHLGNCVFCFKKGTTKIALAIKDEPLLAAEFASMLSSPKVRDFSQKRGLPKNVIYRGSLSLEGISKMYADTDRDYLFKSLKSSKRYDTNSCSESCEIDFDQLDMFKEIK